MTATLPLLTSWARTYETQARPSPTTCSSDTSPSARTRAATSSGGPGGNRE